MYAEHRRRLAALHAHTAPAAGGWLSSLFGTATTDAAAAAPPLAQFNSALTTLHDGGDTRDRLVLSQLMNGPTEVSLDYTSHIVRGVTCPSLPCASAPFRPARRADRAEL